MQTMMPQAMHMVGQAVSCRNQSAGTTRPFGSVWLPGPDAGMNPAEVSAATHATLPGSVPAVTLPIPRC